MQPHSHGSANRGGHSTVPSVQRTSLIAGRPQQAETAAQSLGNGPSAVRVLAGAGFPDCAVPVLELQQRRAGLSQPVQVHSEVFASVLPEGQLVNHQGVSGQVFPVDLLPRTGPGQAPAWDQLHSGAVRDPMVPDHV